MRKKWTSILLMLALWICMKNTAAAQDGSLQIQTNIRQTGKTQIYYIEQAKALDVLFTPALGSHIAQVQEQSAATYDGQKELLFLKDIQVDSAAWAYRPLLFQAENENLAKVTGGYYGVTLKTEAEAERNWKYGIPLIALGLGITLYSVYIVLFREDRRDRDGSLR